MRTDCFQKEGGVFTGCAGVQEGENGGVRGFKKVRTGVCRGPKRRGLGCAEVQEGEDGGMRGSKKVRTEVCCGPRR